MWQDSGFCCMNGFWPTDPPFPLHFPCESLSLRDFKLRLRIDRVWGQYCPNCLSQCPFILMGGGSAEKPPPLNYADHMRKRYVWSVSDLKCLVVGSCHFPETFNSDVGAEGQGWGDLRKRGFLLPNFPISLSKYPKRIFLVMKMHFLVLWLGMFLHPTEIRSPGYS